MMVLHEDSTLMFYQGEEPGSDPVAGVKLSDAPEMLAAGQVNKPRITRPFVEMSDLVPTVVPISGSHAWES